MVGVTGGSREVAGGIQLWQETIIIIIIIKISTTQKWRGGR
jgi:hypothetical protein